MWLIHLKACWDTDTRYSWQHDFKDSISGHSLGLNRLSWVWYQSKDWYRIRRGIGVSPCQILFVTPGFAIKPKLRLVNSCSSGYEECTWCNNESYQSLTRTFRDVGTLWHVNVVPSQGITAYMHCHIFSWTLSALFVCLLRALCRLCELVWVAFIL